MTDRRTDLVQRMVEIADALYVPQVRRVFDAEGVAGLRLLLTGVRSLYHWVACETFTEGLSVFVSLSDAQVLDPEGSSIVDPRRLAQMRLRAATVQVEKDGQLRVWASAADAAVLASTAVLYHFQYVEAPAQPIERIMYSTESTDVMNASGFPSAFAVPSFADLGDALRHFGNIVDSPDPNLEVAWRDAKRLAFLPRPEKHMRRALELYLRHSLRDATIVVRPEQNVNETEPVDIEVSWAYQGRLAWIEIKWLGHSALAGATTWPTSYYEGRALEGARQLADYLDSGVQRVTIPVMGYIVVFDARRRGLTPADVEIDSARGLHFRLRDVTYPNEILGRPDMAPPVRYFMSPVCAA